MFWFTVWVFRTYERLNQSNVIRHQPDYSYSIEYLSDSMQGFDKYGTEHRFVRPKGVKYYRVYRPAVDRFGTLYYQDCGCLDAEQVAEYMDLRSLD